MPQHLHTILQDNWLRHETAHQTNSKQILIKIVHFLLEFFFLALNGLDLLESQPETLPDHSYIAGEEIALILHTVEKIEHVLRGQNMHQFLVDFLDDFGTAFAVGAVPELD